MPFEHTPLIAGAAAAKIIGLCIGVALFFTLPQLAPELENSMLWGLLLWYPTLGGIVGISNLIKRYPWLDLPLPWWIRAPWLGAWMNFVVVLIAGDAMLGTSITVHLFDSLSSSFWFVLDGFVAAAISGLVGAQVEIRCEKRPRPSEPAES